MNLNKMDSMGIFELIEIDENLIRNELHYIDRGEHLKRRKQTNQGGSFKGNQYKKVTEINSESKPSFVEDTANKLNVSERKVEQELQIAKNIVPEVKNGTT